MSPDETFCLLPNTPFNAVPFIGNVLTIGGKQTFSYVEVSFLNTDETERGMTQLTLMSKDRTNLLVYASSVTGSPSPVNYEYSGFGQNVTLAIKGKADTTSLIYLNITIVDNPEKLPFTLTSTFYNMKIDQIKKVDDGDNFITLDTNFEGEIFSSPSHYRATCSIMCFTVLTN
ncbi:predicted protein [Naegleria gruberi]|uniref:Predicted protein n=1 Tax=Naegleria gruberi TaxID=5762 RepID=D2VVD0_NAEGR|nr:uncharacterized protein NAEGRDRAFT_72972 [Naegleria gruberi]EFC39214.1 predicted protein [Naegleria gruberi]|eukprot:XP_002671958.1 predicted protein [Naegleria gruberi strain NEG-M]